MIQLNYERKYIKRKEDSSVKDVFVYRVTGDATEVEAYVKAKVAGGAKAESIKDKDGFVRYYSDRFVANGTMLELTQKGTYFPNTEHWDKIKNLQDQGHSFEAACAMTGTSPE